MFDICIPETPSIEALIEMRAASRVHAKDATLYDFDLEAEKCASSFMGWTDLASNPPYSIAEIIAFAAQARSGGIRDVILIAEGGSSQAAMALTKLQDPLTRPIRFRVLDSTSPSRVHGILSTADLDHALFIASSKSGTTIETTSILSAAISYMEAAGISNVPSHLVAITDPGSALETRALSEKWRAVFSGVASVGGRFSALSVFGLVPAALAGIDIATMVSAAAEMEKACSQDDANNPALRLAAFFYDSACAGRAYSMFCSTPHARALGLWTSQLIAESLGKNGYGIYPYVEADPRAFSYDMGDKTAIVISSGVAGSFTKADEDDMLDSVCSSMPKISCRLESAADMACFFTVFEHTTAMVGALARVCPFDQPDVASAKAAVLDVLASGESSTEKRFWRDGSEISWKASGALGSTGDLESAIEALFAGDAPYVAVNAFVPFTGYARKRELIRIKEEIAEALSQPCMLEIGPRYLHSTGQLQKGGPAGSYLIISAVEKTDIELPEGSKAESLGQLISAQAVGDFKTLDDRGRRAVYVKLPDCSASSFADLADLVAAALV